MKRLIVLLLTISVASPIWSAIAVDSQESAGAGHRATTSPLTWSFTNTAGTKLVCGVVCSVSSGAGITLSSPTYSGTAMAIAGTQILWDGGNVRTAIYYLDTPATGANTVSMACSAGGGIFSILGGCISFTGMNTGAGTSTSGTGTTGTTATAGAITTASGNYIFAGGGWGSGSGGTAGSGFTRTYLTNGSSSTSGDDILGEYQSSAGSSITPTFTWTGSDFWGIAATEFTASGAAAPATSSTMPLLGM